MLWKSVSIYGAIVLNLLSPTHSFIHIKTQMKTLKQIEQIVQQQYIKTLREHNFHFHNILTNYKRPISPIFPYRFNIFPIKLN